MLRLERSDLKFEDQVAVQTHMVKEQVEVEGLTIHREWDLTPYEGETASEFKEQVSQVSEQPTLDRPFFGCLRNSQEIEVVGVLENALRQV